MLDLFLSNSSIAFELKRHFRPYLGIIIRVVSLRKLVQDGQPMLAQIRGMEYFCHRLRLSLTREMDRGFQGRMLTKPGQLSRVEDVSERL